MLMLKYNTVNKRKGVAKMVEALLIVIVILLVVDIYVTIKPKGVDMDPIQRNMDQKLISVEKTLREELTDRKSTRLNSSHRL